MNPDDDQKPPLDFAGFVLPRPEDRDPMLEGWTPEDSPLRPGGRPLDGSGRQPAPIAEHLKGLTDSPTDPHPRRAIYKVRREGWVARRSAARQRFRDLHEKGGPNAENRIVSKLEARGGLLQRARDQAVHPRFNMRGGKP